MPQSLITFSICSIIHFSPTSLENSIDKELKCVVEWRRIFPQHCKTNIFRDQILYQSSPVDYQETITYKCSPFDYRSIIMAKLFQIQKIDNNQKGVTDNKIQIDEISFGPIQGPSSLDGKLDLKRKQQVEIILNKTCYKDTEVTVMKRMVRNSFQGMNIKIKTDGNQLNISFNKEQLEEEQFPIKIYDKDDTVIGFYVYHQYHQFMSFLRKLNVCCHYGKYLKVNCKSQGHRNEILFKIFCCCDENIAGDFLKSQQNPESKLTINCKSAYDYLNINSKPQMVGGDTGLMLMNTFGNSKYPPYNYCSSSESGYEPIDSPYFNNNQNNKVKTEQNMYKYQSAHNRDSEPIQKPPQVSKDNKSIYDEIDNLLGEDSDDFYLSPSEHMIEDIYKILYTPYSKEQKDRKQSFSDINEFCLKDSVSNSNFHKKQSKKSLKFQEGLIKPKRFRETLDVKKNNHFQTKTEEHPKPLMNIVLEQPPSKTQAYSQKQSLHPGPPQILSHGHLSDNNIMGTFKAHSLSPQEVHNLNSKENFLHEKIDHLTKINQQLMRQNVHLKSIIKFERQKKQKFDLIKMNEIKQMALMMVKRLEHVQQQNLRKDAYCFQDKVGQIVQKKYRDLQTQKGSSNPLFCKRSRSPTYVPKIMIPKPPFKTYVPQAQQKMRKISQNKSLNSSKSANDERSKNHLIVRPKQGTMRKYGSNYMERKVEKSESGQKAQKNRKSSLQKVLPSPKGQIGNLNDKKYQIPKFLRNRTSQGSYNLVFDQKHKHGRRDRNEHLQSFGSRGNFEHIGHKVSYENSQKLSGMRNSNTIINYNPLS